MMLSVLMLAVSVLELVIVVQFLDRIVPSGVAKKCVALETRHTNTSSCTRGAGGDTPQLTPREACFQRDTQDSKQALFRPDAPAPREAPSEEAGDDWLN